MGTERREKERETEGLFATPKYWTAAPSPLLTFKRSSPTQPPNNKIWAHIFEKLNLSENALQAFYDIFWAIDRDQTGTVNRLEVLMYFNMN